MDLLEMPLVLTSLQVARNDRRREQVVPTPFRLIAIGGRSSVLAKGGVPGGYVDHTEGGIQGRGSPDPAAPTFIGFPFPRVRKTVACCRNRVELPNLLACLGVVRTQLSPESPVPTRSTDVHQSVAVDWRH